MARGRTARANTSKARSGDVVKTATACAGCGRVFSGNNQKLVMKLAKRHTEMCKFAERGKAISAKSKAALDKISKQSQALHTAIHGTANSKRNKMITAQVARTLRLREDYQRQHHQFVPYHEIKVEKGVGWGAEMVVKC